jgi:hypothetical protein
MSSPDRSARSYEDIIRKTVPLPDSSYRPTDAERIESEVPREPALVGPHEGTMRDALQALTGVDLTDLQVDVEGGTATMRGSVARKDDRDRIEATLRGVPGVDEVRDQLRIRLE